MQTKDDHQTDRRPRRELTREEKKQQTRERQIREITATLQKCISRHYVREFATELHVELTADQGRVEAEALLAAEERPEDASEEAAGRQGTSTSPGRPQDRRAGPVSREGRARSAQRDADAGRPRMAEVSGAEEAHQDVAAQGSPRHFRAGSEYDPGRARVPGRRDYDDAGLPGRRHLGSDGAHRGLLGSEGRDARVYAAPQERHYDEGHLEGLSEKEKLVRGHAESSERQQYKLMKALANVTPHDRAVEQRQKYAQLRFGDIICLSYQEKVGGGERGAAGRGEAGVYRSLVHSDGVTDRGLKVLPLTGTGTQTALNQFKQCLFRVEIQQNCTYHMREAKLIQQKREAENRLKKLVQESGREGPNPAQQDAIKKEIDLIAKDLEETVKKRSIQDENNRYEQRYREGNRLTYGVPIMLRHQFSGKFLSLKLDEVSKQPGQNVLTLSEAAESCWFILEPRGAQGSSAGRVINFADYFYIRALNCKTPFYLHVVQDKTGGFNLRESYPLNACQEPSILKAKLFMNYDECAKDKEYVSSGDCIRLRQLEVGGYLTSSARAVDRLLPTEPDFLKGQIRRMYLGQRLGQRIERQKGGLDVGELHGNESKYYEADQKAKLQPYELALANEECFNRLKARECESIYLETDADELKFTNSCWEVQRANPLQGGSLSVGEIVKLKHIGTGKYLALADDGVNVELLSHSNALNCLFYLRAPHSSVKTNVFTPQDQRPVLTEETCTYIAGGSNVILQSFLVEQYLQVDSEHQDGAEDGQERHDGAEPGPFGGDDAGEPQAAAEAKRKIIAAEYLKRARSRMIFEIEEVEPAKSIFSYQGSLIFDKLLRFYAFLNVWAVSLVKQADKSEETYYKHEDAAASAELLEEMASQLCFTLANVDALLRTVQFDLETSHKCKTELAEQGFLDMILRILQLGFYKMMPPPLFEKPFKSTKERFEEAKLKANKREQLGLVNLATFRIDQYTAQGIAREALNPVVLRALEILLMMVRDHEGNSELVTKYQSVLYQLYVAHEKFFLLSQTNPYFQSTTCPDRQFLFLIAETCRRMMKNSQLLHSIGEERDESKQPIPYQSIEKTVDCYTVQKWLSVLGPVRFLNKEDQNLDLQIMILNVLTNFCKSESCRGVYPYQVQIRKYVLLDGDGANIPIKFGTGLFKNVLRPFVYLERPKAEMTLQQFLDNNPILGENNNFRIDQKGQVEYEMALDLHELTRNCNKEGSESQPYIDYICACIDLLLACTMGGRFEDTKERFEAIGLDQEHLLLCISPDAERLVIHEQLKQAYLQVCNQLYVDTSVRSERIKDQNRCYIWEKCRPTAEEIMNNNEYFTLPTLEEKPKPMPGRSEEPILCNFAEELSEKRLTSMHNPNECMIRLAEDKANRDEKMVRAVKDNIIWFLTKGPSGTEAFFEDHTDKLFIHSSLKLKLKSVKTYLDAIITVLKNDVIEPKFIENVKMICQSALLGSLHYGKEQEKEVPSSIRRNWLYLLMWVAKDVCLKSAESWKTENALTRIGCQIFDIFDLVSVYRLNLQVEQFVIKFRMFEETRLYPDKNQEAMDFARVEADFDELFKIQQYDIKLQLTDLYNNLLQQEALPASARLGTRRKKKLFDASAELGRLSEELKTKKIPLDQIFLNIIISPLTNIQVKQNALEVLIKNLNQRDILIKELTKTEVIVDCTDYQRHLEFFETLRRLESSLDSLMIGETYSHMIDVPQAQTKQHKDSVVARLKELIETMKEVEPLPRRRLQNLIRHSGLIDCLLNKTVKKLEHRQFYYKDLFQTIIDFFHQSCLGNPSVQKILLPDLNYFLDMMNQRISTDRLIGEIIKSNASETQRKDFAEYLISKILSEGYFRSSLINYLTKLAQSSSGEEGFAGNDEEENSNQQFIMKRIIESSGFRSLLYMTRATTSTKLGIIKTYVKAKQEYERLGKEEDHELLQAKEALDLHIAVVDLISTCARSSIYGISQVQKLIDVEELLDSLITDAIPFVIKSHYFNLLFEVYLRKVQGQEDSQRLPVTEHKFVSMLKHTIYGNLDESFTYFRGLFLDCDTEMGPGYRNNKLESVLKKVAENIEKTREERFLRGGDQDREKEREQREALCSFKNTTPFLLLDASDGTEYWRSLNSYDAETKTHLGMFVFIANLYKHYTVRELDDPYLAETTCRIREALLTLAFRICEYVDGYDSYMQPFVQDLLFQLNQAVQTMPDRAMLRGEHGKQDEADEEEAKNANDVDNRMSREKIIRIIRDHIMRENITVEEGLGLKDDHEGERADQDVLKEGIKRVCGSQASYHDVKKALDYFHNVTVEKEKKRREEQADHEDTDEGLENGDGNAQHLYITELTAAIELSLHKAGYRLPHQQEHTLQTERSGTRIRKEGSKEGPHEADQGLPDAAEELGEEDLALAVQTDFKLFAQRFAELIVKQANSVEVHGYVNMLMCQDSLLSFEAKEELVRNLLRGFLGLEGDDDELVLISILNLIIQRLIPEGEPEHATLAERKEYEESSADARQTLREWQNVMFEAGVPQFLMEMTSVEQDPMLAHKALTLLNNLLFEASAENQQRVLDLLQEDERFFEVFRYMQQRIVACKAYILGQLKERAREDFVARNLSDAGEAKRVTKPNDFKNHKVYLSPKFDLESKYEELQSNWREEEIFTILQFLSLFCENCFRPAQLYLKSQLADTGAEAIGMDITSVDLIYQVIQLLIELSDDMGPYVFSAYRTNTLIPAILDTFIEFLYGPCLENQQFLGGNKKLISVLNDLIVHEDLANYAPNHLQSSARLRILHRVSKVLLAIVDIKDEDASRRVHEVVLAELDAGNLVRICVEIYANRIGANEEMLHAYDYDMRCDHYRRSGYSCVEGEYCELGYLLPADLETIEAGFNFYQALQILAKSNPSHASLQRFRRDEQEYLQLLENEDEFLVNVAYQHTRTCEGEARNYDMWTKLEARVLDELIIKTYPETFTAFVEKTASELRDLDQSAKLVQRMLDAKKTKNPIDRQQKLHKIRAVIRDVIMAAPADAPPATTPQTTSTSDQQRSFSQLAAPSPSEGNQQELAESLTALDQAETARPFKKVKTSTTTKCLQSLGLRSNRVHDFTLDEDEDEAQDEEVRLQRAFERDEFEQQLERFKFYLASNFYDDSVAHIELLQATDGPLVTCSFRMPSSYKYLTAPTSDAIPYFLNQVSQQEKLEAFVGQRVALTVELQWQQRLGQLSVNLKSFANRWELLSWGNFLAICLTNLTMLLYLGIDELTGAVTFSNQVAARVYAWVGTIQSAIAFVVVLSYYLEYRAVLKHKIQENEVSEVVELRSYGCNKGSYGYGSQRGRRSQVGGLQQSRGCGDAVRKYVASQGRLPTKIAYLCLRELLQFASSFTLDATHARNIIYFVISLYASREDGLFWNTLLLLDIVCKIKTLNQVGSIFAENSVALLSTLALFGVLLYIYAFAGFATFRSYYSADEGVPCESLGACLLSTMNMGLRSGGGIGDVLTKAKPSDAWYATQWFYNFSFFMVINLVLMNIFFGIIIDSFAEKRAKEAEIQDEVQGQCFICGISKSTFEIENVPWKEHIYTAHNLHAFMSFLIRVDGLDRQDCTGIEKFVKHSLESGVICFFPINRCLAVRGGEPIE